MAELQAMNVPHDDGARAELVFRGEILVHRQVPALVRAIANDSDRWDIRELRERRAAGKKGDYPLLPVATEPVETADELRIVIEPGDLLCFSGAHLHGSVANTSGLTRFSAEFRTVNERDRRDGRGARNDGRVRPALRWSCSEVSRTEDPWNRNRGRQVRSAGHAVAPGG